MFEQIVDFTYSTGNIQLTIPEEDLIIHFYNFLYNLNNDNLNYDIIDDQYFFMKYHSDFVNLFMELRDISISQGSDIFKDSNADKLMHFANQFMYSSDDIVDDDIDNLYMDDDIYL